jgi:hypothetical protein
MDVWKLCVNILSLVLDVLLFIAAVINMLRIPNFIVIIEMVYVCIFTALLFIVEVVPAERLREFVNTYCRFWMKLLGRGLTYIFIGCLTFRDFTITPGDKYVLAVSIISIIIGFLFSVGHFFFTYEFDVGDLFQSFQSKV